MKFLKCLCDRGERTRVTEGKTEGNRQEHNRTTHTKKQTEAKQNKTKTRQQQRQQTQTKQEDSASTGNPNNKQANSKTPQGIQRRNRKTLKALREGVLGKPEKNSERRGEEETAAASMLGRNASSPR